MIGNDDAREIILLQDFQHAQHIHCAVIDESLLIVRHFVAHVAQMDVTQFLLATISFDCVINVAVFHFRNRADAEFECVARAGFQIDQFLIKLRLPDQPWLGANERQRRIVGMRGHRDTRFLGYGHQFS